MRTFVLSVLVAGIALAAFLTLTDRDPFLGLNAGFIALAVNFAVTIMISLLTRLTGLTGQAARWV